MEKPKNCQVCGRKNGVKNFGAISCLSCAAFFPPTKRISLAVEDVGCRLKRCLEAGMEKEKVQAIKIHSLQKQRQNEQQQLLLNVKTELPADNLQAESNMGWFNKSEYLEKITKHGLSTSWLECPPRCLYTRATLILFGMLMALPSFGQFDIQDQMLQLIGANAVTTHLLLPFQSLKLSSECMITPIGVSQIEMYRAMRKFYGSEIFEQLPYDIFVKPMKAFATLNLDKLESTLLMYILLSNGRLSKKATEILHAESEKFGKMLLRLQQHRFGEQPGALRYMDSLRLFWSAVARARKFQEMTICLAILHNGRHETIPNIIKSINF